MKPLRGAAYIAMMLYFLGIVTGGINLLVSEYKVSCSFVLEGEDETSNSRLLQNLIEEDVICQENYFPFSCFERSSTLKSHHHTSCITEVSIRKVVPPPEHA